MTSTHSDTLLRFIYGFLSKRGSSRFYEFTALYPRAMVHLIYTSDGFSRRKLVVKTYYPVLEGVTFHFSTSLLHMRSTYNPNILLSCMFSLLRCGFSLTLRPTEPIREITSSILKHPLPSQRLGFPSHYLEA